MPNQYLQIFTRRNSALLLLLGFASGLPLALTSGTLQAWMAVENVDIKTIGFFSLVGQAYVFKFLWSPLMDRYTLPFLGRRRGWLLVTQILLTVGIALMGFMQPSHDLTLLAALAVLIAFCSASQDIVFDAWKTDVLTVAERGGGAAISVLGYRLAMLVSGGLALWLADRFLGWQAIWWLMAAMMFPGIIATLLAREPENSIKRPRSLEEAAFAPLGDFFNRNNAWLILSLIVLYKLGDAFAASLNTIFLIRGVGFDAGEVGLVNKTLGLMATIIGALAGGMLMQRLSLFRALMLFGTLQAVSNLGYWMLAVTDKNLFNMAAAVAVENLCGGMGTAAFVALLMTLCNRSFSATQFALLSALAAVGRVYVGPVAGWFVESWGWSAFYAFTVVAALPGLLLLAGCKSTLEYAQNHSDFPPRSTWLSGYRWALRALLCGCVLLAGWLLLLMLEALGWLTVSGLSNALFEIGIVLLLGAIVLGTSLDYMTTRKNPDSSTP
ncbi:muropeptide MFS transporter AmpG [Erwinia pyrifoliae]|uniref:Muropeptide MFS transporter AmpG n=1 Tax=Erwinia pyrifoliae TaxID=79967 RepID=A0ABY5X593_ERWPY|nr:muropeptide MFS transporter AmpG [Erwinia pyrifoliae]AUX71941.1 AmpG family muropeptide MFS transporter [Erwinia pyrifoliae]MCA8877820.1 muropeptide MFS transporter AmpG [Erwinia pyrifoliae]MCT2388174.1 muropeptide MFS transporter AmpG [Erwinia pyrifoliae]MCU8586344.1 muropeptide MFS transporter AmpG [Erwinia pyrifoliae]UWS30250.1 muropeptide MFS transporter AmpG [Erwinia pyrifoliae]